MAIERVRMQDPAARQPIVNPETGCLTPYGIRFLGDLFRRSGGYESGLYELFLAILGGDATLAEVAAAGEENTVLIDGLRSVINGGLIEALQQDTEQLRKEIENVKAISAGNTGESLQQEISDLRQEIAQLNAQIQGIRGEDTIYQVQVVSGEIGSLASVATSGAYADLSGTPALALVATSGDYDDLTDTPAAATGWTADTGTAERGSHATYTAPTISVAYTQAEIQAIANSLQDVTRAVKALKDDGLSYGNISV